MHAFAQMEKDGTGIGEFPAFCQKAFDVIGGAELDSVIENFGVNCPVVRGQFFKPCRLDARNSIALIRVEHGRVQVKTNGHGAAVLRNTK